MTACHTEGQRGTANREASLHMQARDDVTYQIALDSCTGKAVWIRDCGPSKHIEPKSLMCLDPECRTPVFPRRAPRWVGRSTCCMLGYMAGFVTMGLWFQLVLTGYHMDDNTVEVDAAFDLAPLDQPPRLRSLHSSQNITQAEREWVITQGEASARDQQANLRGTAASGALQYRYATHQMTIYMRRGHRSNVLAWHTLRRLFSSPGSVRWWLHWDWSTAERAGGGPPWHGAATHQRTMFS